MPFRVNPGTEWSQSMRIEVISQFLTPKTQLDAIRNVFLTSDLDFAVISVAYISSGGVKAVAEILRQFGPRVRVFGGINNRVTSVQGLQCLLDIGVQLNVVDTGANGLVFRNCSPGVIASFPA
jgi:hypothetical protein